MTTLEIKGNWNIIKGYLKQKWATLTDDDLYYSEGQHDEIVGRVQKRTGETRQAVEAAIMAACVNSLSVEALETKTAAVESLINKPILPQPTAP